MYRAYIPSKSARSPRFRTERENWVQRVVADGHAICIRPERSAAAAVDARFLTLKSALEEAVKDHSAL